MSEEVKFEYFDRGGVKAKRVYRDGVLHREGAPAVIIYHNDSEIPNLPHIYNYYILGKSHREDGPARLFYSKNGTCHYEGYYLCGEYIIRSNFGSIIELSERMETYNRNQLILECAQHESKFIRERCKVLLCLK